MLDLGSGGGIDVLLSARRVGPTGKAYGVDMTDEMLALARANAEKAGASNVEFVKGTIEAVPLPDESVDVVISNCVINLSTDKPAVLAEAHRLLRPGGRFGVSDVVAEDHLDATAAGRAGQLRRLHRRSAQHRRVPRRPGRRRIHRHHHHPHAPGRRRDALGDHPGEQADSRRLLRRQRLLHSRRAGRRPDRHRRRGQDRQRLRVRLLTFGGHDNRVVRPPMGGQPTAALLPSAPPR